jgi:hypothetical protein
MLRRWSLIVAIVHSLLILARVVVAVEPRPWENKHREPTPQQVRRGLNKLLPQLGMPTRPSTTPGKIARAVERDENWQGNTVSGRSECSKLPPLVLR